MLRISQLKLPVEHTPEQLRKKILRTIHIREDELKGYYIRKRSLDARKKPELYYVYTIDIDVLHEERLRKKKGIRLEKAEDTIYHAPEQGKEQLPARPVITGCGPAGLFCAFLLAREGYRPLVLERGAPVRERQNDVEQFWETGRLNPSSNVQFGEGGAGTFSDGKLNTLVKDSKGRNRFVLETFVRFGAPPEILYEQKPHIGTDILIRVVENMREEIIRLGGEFRFHTCVTDILPEQRLLIARETGAEGKEIQIPAGAAVFAIGHSARDTFQMLYERQIPMEAKSFAVGVRAEHLQQIIDRSQYGRTERGRLPAASYKLAEKLDNGRGVYTFCMCPGGYVVNASSEEGGLAVNGMSYHGRAGRNANSAVIVTVTPEDYGSGHPLAGVWFQRELERRAWEAGQGAVPVQLFGDYLEKRMSTGFGRVLPCIRGAFAFGDVRGIFPEEIGDSIAEGILAMDRRIHGFGGEDTVLSGVESRTSSPVRILRNEDLVSDALSWLYPCGEGAGYAGGITSAAMDGLKTAEAIIRKYAKDS